MTGAISLIGATLVVGCAIFLSRAYGAFAERRRAETEEFYLFILHIKGEVARFLSKPERIFQSFEAQSLDSVGFLSVENLVGDAPLSSAYGAVRDKLSVSSGADKILYEFFSGFGRDYRDGEIKRCDAYAEELSRLWAREEGELVKSLKVTRAVLAAAALGIVILLI